jgi:hypothetical protein
MSHIKFLINSKFNWDNQLNFQVQLERLAELSTSTGKPAELQSSPSAQLVLPRKLPGSNWLNRFPGRLNRSLTGPLLVVNLTVLTI